MPKIGVQAMMLKQQVAERGAFEVWRKLADIGFSVVEVSQIALTRDTRDQIVRAGEEFGMTVAAISASMGPGGGNDSLLESFDKVVSDARSLDTGHVRIGRLPLLALESTESLISFAHDVNEMALRLADYGITLSYHNHHVEFARVNGQHVLDLIRTEAPALKFELDVHWIQRGGMDPVRLLAAYSGVVDLVHLKDYRVAVPPSEAFEALTAGDRQTWSEHWSKIIQFAEVGQGNLDFASVIAASLDSGAEYLLIEQDDCYGRDIYDCLADSRTYLVDLGYERLL